MSDTDGSSARPWRRNMVARDRADFHRAPTNLELIFDLTFVVAVAQAAGELADALARGHLHQGIQGYLSVFFAIWWAWMNFSWFASAFDTDDVPYRLLTLLQMAGVLVLAAGVPAAFHSADFVGVTAGYVVMRVAMIAQWLRAGLSDPASRATCLRYAGAIGAVQVAWVARLALPGSLATAGFLVLALADASVPFWAERPGMTSWHPEHIVERFWLFTIIVLGEGIAQVAGAFQGAFTAEGVTGPLVVIAGTGLILLFALWWLYFARPVGEGLREHPNRAFVWGYEHLIVFAALAAIAAGLAVAIRTVESAPDGSGVVISHTAIALSIAGPVGLFLLVCGALTTGLVGDRVPPLGRVALSAVSTVALAFTAAVTPLPVALALVSLPSVLLVVDNIVEAHRLARRSIQGAPVG